MCRGNHKYILKFHFFLFNINLTYWKKDLGLGLSDKMAYYINLSGMDQGIQESRDGGGEGKI